MADLVEILQEAKRYYVGAELFAGYLGEDIVPDGDDVVLLFRSADGGISGVRFDQPRFPQEGLAYRGVWLRNARDWVLDLKIVLGEELGTGALFATPPVTRSGWREFSVSPEHWEGEPGRTIGDWADPPGSARS